MRGVVADSGRAILPIEILCPKYPIGVRVDAWIDTGFTGDLVLPQSLIDPIARGLSPVSCQCSSACDY